jgi:hypothetical protein
LGIGAAKAPRRGCAHLTAQDCDASHTPDYLAKAL